MGFTNRYQAFNELTGWTCGKLSSSFRKIAKIIMPYRPLASRMFDVVRRKDTMGGAIAEWRADKIITRGNNRRHFN